MSNKYYVYAYLDPRRESSDHRFTNEPFYIGRGSYSRLNYHINEAKRLPDTIPHSMFKSKRLNMLKINKIRSILSEGLEPIIVKLYTDLTMEESKLKELELIKGIGRSIFGDGPLTNLTEGGEGRHICHVGRFNPFYGKTHTPEIRQRLSEIHKGKIISDEHKEIISKTHRGRRRRVEIVERQRSYMRKMHNDDPNNPIFQRLGERNSKTWIVTTPDGDRLEVISLRKFCKEHGLNVKTLMTAYNQKRSTRDGWSVELNSQGEILSCIKEYHSATL